MGGESGGESSGSSGGSGGSNRAFIREGSRDGGRKGAKTCGLEEGDDKNCAEAVLKGNDDTLVGSMVQGEGREFGEKFGRLTWG